MENKERYCNFYNCWCNDVDTNIEATDDCNYRCNRCSYSEYKSLDETFYTEK